MKAVDSTNFTVNSITELQQNNEQNHTDNTNDIITLNNPKKMVPKNLNSDDDSVNKTDDNQREFGTVVNGNHKNDTSQHLNGTICSNGISSENKLMNLSLKNNTDIIKNGNNDKTNSDHVKVNKNCVNGISSLSNGTLVKNDVKASLESLNDTDIRLERGSDERKSMNSTHSSHSRTTQLDTDHENDLDDLLHRSSNGGDQQIHGYGNLQILQVDSGVESAASSWDRMAEVKEHAFARLQDELKKAHEELKLRDEEVTRLSRIRKEVESELEDLTASLFQEAHNMVREANMRQAAAEKSLKESNMQIEVLTAEVSALKTLVLTSTPSRPNPHLHPQIDLKSKEDANGSGSGLFRKQHRRSPSHFNLKYGRESSPPDSPTKEQQSTTIPTNSGDSKESIEVDPVLHKEFLAWKQQPTMEKNDPFIERIYREDINWCLEFNNTLLGKEVQEAIENGSICIEAVSDKTKTHFPKKCALLESSRQCHYRMRFGDSETSYCISQICRNRITAVCDCLNYLRYIQRGLVKSSVHDIYWEIVRLRKEISLARLGLTLTSSS